jgi:hypothetical protein
VLYLLGKFGEMTSTEIRRKMSVINQSRYTFELLENLHPPTEKRMRLFVWEEFTSSNLKELFPLLYPLALTLKSGDKLPYNHKLNDWVKKSCQI